MMMSKTPNMFHENQSILMNGTHHGLFPLLSSVHCEEICFSFLIFDEVVTLAKATHCWGLTDLHIANSAYVVDQNLLAG